MREQDNKPCPYDRQPGTQIANPAATYLEDTELTMCISARHHCLLIAILTALAVAVPSHALLRVSPAVIEGNFENGRLAGSFVVSNTADEDIRVRATPVYFHLTPEGQIKQWPLDEYALTNWVKITPREFALAGQAERQIRYVVVAPDSVPEGSYWGGIEFLPVPNANDSAAAKSQLLGIAAVLVPVLGEKGNPARIWSLQADSMYSMPTPAGVTIYTPLVNSSLGRVAQKGQYEIRNSAGMVVRTGETQRSNIFPYSTRILRTTLPADFPPGSYEFALTLTADSDGSTQSGTLRFEVPESLPQQSQKAR